MQNKIIFTTINDRITKVTPYNTRVIIERSDGDVAVVRTAVNFIKYSIYQRTAGVRHIFGVLRMTRRFAA